MTAGRTTASLSQDWSTPHKYVEAVKYVLGGTIDLDPCSNEYSIVRANTEYRLPEHDGLKETWNFKTIYVNPPYASDKERGTTIKNWLTKCLEANRMYNAEVIALVPVATNTSHWKKCVWGQANAVAFLYDTRLKFLVNGKDEGKGAPMSCAMIYWGKDYDCFAGVFNNYGAVVDIRNLHGKRLGEHLKNPAQLPLFSE